MNREIAGKAKKYARSKGRSLSNLVEDYLEFLTRQMDTFVSSLSFGNISYALRRFATHEKVISRLKAVSELLCILPVDEHMIKNALQSRFKDFEDAIQYQTVRSEPDIEAIVTRNIKDYKSAGLPVMTPETFLKTYLHNS